MTETDVEPEADVASDAGARRNPPLAVPLLAAVILAIASAFLGGAVVSWWDDNPRPGAVDIGFYDDMTVHHQQAIQMARIYQQHGDDADMISRANEIDFDQAGDIRVMQNALVEWGESGSPDIAMEWMGESTSPDEMPGLATPEEIAALEQARGVELDDQFTRLMINHHAGGVHMAEFAAESAKLGDVRDFAEQMALNQQREIEELNNARIARGLEPVEPQR